MTTAAPERDSAVPLAEYLGWVLRGLRPLPALDLDLTQASGNTIAEDVIAPGPLPAFDHAAIDGYAARCEDIVPATPSRPVRLNVIGDLAASSWRPVRLTSGTCFSVAAGAPADREGICDDDPEAVRGVLDDQTLRADLIITTGGTRNGPGDMVRRILSRGTVSFTDVSVYPCSSLGFGTIGGTEVPVVCLPGGTGSALIGFEVLARPVIQVLAGAEPVFRPSVRAHLLETVYSPTGLREFRPAQVAERRGGGYTVQPLAGGPYTLSGLAEANAVMVLGEKVISAPAGSTVDVLLLDRRR